MKALLFAAAIAIGGAAFAQEMTPPANSGPPAPAATDTATPSAGGPAATPTDPAAPADTTAPTTDSAMPAPESAAPADNASTATAAPAADYPACSRTVTDKCIQGAKGRKHRK